MMTDEAPSAGHNVGERRDAIIDAMREMFALDGEIEAVIERDIKELRQQKSEIKANLRERFSLTAKMVQARYAAYKIEREAAAAGDTVTLAMIHELFEALPVGGEVDLVDALAKSEDAAA